MLYSNECLYTLVYCLVYNIFVFYSEEISFYQGSVREEQNIRKMFGRLVSELAYTSLIGHHLVKDIG